MRINLSNVINNSLAGGSRVFDPGPPSVNINNLLELQIFRTSKSIVLPFEKFNVNWVVTPKKADIDLNDYDFRIKTEGFYVDNGGRLAATDTIELLIHKKTSLSLQTKLKTENFSSAWKNIGAPIVMSIDDSNCVHRPIPLSFLQAALQQKVNSALSIIPELNLKRSVEYTWRHDHIAFLVPIEIVLNNFFNGDLDITWKIFFDVYSPSDDENHLGIRILSNENADFHWLEDFISLGNSATIAKTIEKLLPVILAPIIEQSEREILAEISMFLDIGNFLDTHILVDVSIDTDELDFILCERSPSPPT